MKKFFAIAFFAAMIIGQAHATEVVIKTETFDAGTYSIDESRHHTEPQSNLVVKMDTHESSSEI